MDMSEQVGVGTGDAIVTIVVSAFMSFRSSYSNSIHLPDGREAKKTPALVTTAKDEDVR